MAQRMTKRQPSQVATQPQREDVFGERIWSPEDRARYWPDNPPPTLRLCVIGGVLVWVVACLLAAFVFAALRGC